MILCARVLLIRSQKLLLSFLALYDEVCDACMAVVTKTVSCSFFNQGIDQDLPLCHRGGGFGT